MAMVRIVSSPNRHVRPGDFDIEVIGNQLHVPPEFSDVLERMGARNIDAIVSALLDFPTAFLRARQMSQEEMLQARDGAITKLKPYAAVDISSVHSGFPSGALPPSTAKKRSAGI